jgi:hypothetical protein
VRQATEKVNLENGKDPIYKSQLSFYPEQNGDHNWASASSRLLVVE